MKANKHVSVNKKRTVKYLLKQRMSKLAHAGLRHKFKKFENQNLLLFPAKAFTEKAKLKEIGKRYDAVICGSDQVWNPDVTGFDLSYFLDFCAEETQRISYAPSFGVATLPEKFFEDASRELNKFSSVSVRESVGRALIQQMTGRSVPIVVDPTMLMDASEWEKLESSKKRRKDEYILYYVVRNSKSLFAKCREFAEKTGLKMVVIGGNFMKQIKNGDPYIEYAVDASPSEWLNLVHNARYVVTNSFHGTAFSVIFRKDFYVEVPATANNSRLTNIVEALGLVDRIVPMESAIIPSDADYSKAEEKLSELCQSSIDYLKKALGESL